MIKRGQSLACSFNFLKRERYNLKYWLFAKTHTERATWLRAELSVGSQDGSFRLAPRKKTALATPPTTSALGVEHFLRYLGESRENVGVREINPLSGNSGVPPLRLFLRTWSRRPDTRTQLRSSAYFLELLLQVFSWGANSPSSRDLTAFPGIISLQDPLSRRGTVETDEEDSGGRETGSGRVPAVRWDPAGLG